MSRGLTGTETGGFSDSRRLSFTKWANDVPGIPDELKGGGGLGRRWGWWGLPVGRGGARRILRTSSLGGTIWPCHTDALQSSGLQPTTARTLCSLWFCEGRGGSSSDSPVFAGSFSSSALTVSVMTYRWMEEPKWLPWEELH